MRTVTEESLRRRLARLESALESEKARLRKVCGGIPWGAGMRRTKCTPSFRREDELIGKIKAVRRQLSQMSAGGDNLRNLWRKSFLSRLFAILYSAMH